MLVLDKVEGDMNVEFCTKEEMEGYELISKVPIS